MKTLLPYQATALARAITLPRLPLFLQMRLGKSIVSIRWALHWDPARVLVVAPLTTLRGWQEELSEENQSAVLLIGSPARRCKIAVESQARWHLTNYEGLRGLHAKTDFAGLPYDVVILDESTCIKNNNAQQEAACEMFRTVPYRAVLSGEPTPEGIEDIFNQFLFLDGHFMGFDNFFKWRYEFFSRVGFGWFAKPGAIRKIKEYYLARSIVLSRKQAGVFDAKIYERRYVTLPRETLAGIEECLAMFEYTPPDTALRVSTKFAMVAATWAHRLCGGFTPGGERQVNTAKQDELVKLLKGELSKEPVVVWFTFNAELYAAYEALKAAGISAVEVCGDFDREERAEAISSFQRGAVRVILVQKACARFGLNLSRADTEIYLSNSTKFELRNQSEDRPIHLSKKKAVLVLDIVAENSPDEDLVDLLLMKKVEARALKRNFDARLVQRIQAAKERLSCKNDSRCTGQKKSSPQPSPRKASASTKGVSAALPRASGRIRLVIAEAARSTKSAAAPAMHSAARTEASTRTPRR